MEVYLLKSIIDDDQIETIIQYTRMATDSQLPSDIEHDDVSPATDLEEISGHGMTIYGEVASCRCISGDDSLVDCKACLTTERNNLDENSAPERREIFHTILNVVDNAGESGVTLATLQVSFISI